MAKKWNKKIADQIKSGEKKPTVWGWSLITVGQILEELSGEGLYISRPTLSRLEKHGLFKMRRSVGGWRTASRAEADAIKKLIWINYTGLSREEYLKQQELEEKEKEENGKQVA